MTVFARVDHTALAAEHGLTLRPTELLIFGDPLAGSPLMEAQQTTGIDLPLKVLVWQDSQGGTWVTYNDPEWIVQRHGSDAGGHQTARRMATALAVLTNRATE
jgi:uncharacterized protein (DUF302 family)